MNGANLKRVWGGIFAGSLMFLGLSAQANVIRIDQDSNRAEVECTAEAFNPACSGVINTPGVLSDSFADIYGAPASEANLTGFLNTLMSLTLSADDATRIDTGGADTATFSTDALWFAIKTGAGTSFFRNNAGLLDLTVDYAKASGPAGAGMGISNVTFWGATRPPERVPEPGVLALLAVGLLGLALLRRKPTAG